MAGRNKINFTIKTLIMEIKVTGCHDCPFAEIDFDQTSRHWCEHFANKGDIFDVETHVYWSTIHPSCPLKQETITIKLKENVDTNIKRH